MMVKRNIIKFQKTAILLLNLKLNVGKKAFLRVMTQNLQIGSTKMLRAVISYYP